MVKGAPAVHGMMWQKRYTKFHHRYVTFSIKIWAHIHLIFSLQVLSWKYSLWYGFLVHKKRSLQRLSLRSSLDKDLILGGQLLLICIEMCVMKELDCVPRGGLPVVEFWLCCLVFKWPCYCTFLPQFPYIPMYRAVVQVKDRKESELGTGSACSVSVGFGCCRNVPQGRPARTVCIQTTKQMNFMQ